MIEHHSLEDGCAGVPAVLCIPPVGLECIDAVAEDTLDLHARVQSREQQL